MGTCSPIYSDRPSMPLFIFNDSIISLYFEFSGISLLFSIQTSIDFINGLNCIPLLQLGTLAGFISLFEVPLVNSLKAFSKLVAKLFTLSSNFCFFISSLYQLLTAFIFFLYVSHSFVQSSSVKSVLLVHTLCILVPSTSLCNMVGSVHNSHPLSQSSLSSKIMYKRV